MENENGGNERFDSLTILLKNSDETLKNSPGLKNWRAIIISMINVPEKMTVSEFSNVPVYRWNQGELYFSTDNI
jgi:hypothetical protein